MRNNLPRTHLKALGQIRNIVLSVTFMGILISALHTDGTNTIVGENRSFRSGRYNGPVAYISSSSRFDKAPTDGNDVNRGFRVASVIPEPSCLMLVIAVGGYVITRREV